MDDFRLDSYCGLYCGACEILNLYRRSLETNRPVGWEDLPKRFGAVIPQSDLICRGCKTETVFAGCQRCSVRKCARGKGVEACILCASYPCEQVKGRIAHLNQRRPDSLPHARVMFRNLEALKERGLEHWAESQRQLWSCPRCRAPFTWYQEICRDCGLELEAVKEYNRY